MKTISMTMKNGEVVISSEEIARLFGKTNTEVVAGIMEREEALKSLSDTHEIYYRTFTSGKGRQGREAFLNERQAIFIAMGYSGRRVDHIKVEFMQEFLKHSTLMDITDQVEEIEEIHEDPVLVEKDEDFKTPFKLPVMTTKVEEDEDEIIIELDDEEIKDTFNEIVEKEVQTPDEVEESVLTGLVAHLMGEIEDLKRKDARNEAIIDALLKR
jgi:phage regulator Rha-like protein